MPVVALMLNFAWETLYAIIGLLYARYHRQTWWDVLWMLTDLGIIYTYFAYGRTEFPPFITRSVFYFWSLLLLTIAFFIQIAFLAEVEGPIGAVNYSAFLQNAFMSGSFIVMFIARGGNRGQSLTIAVGKCIGSIAPVILLSARSKYVLLVGLVIVILDVIYIGLLAYAKRIGGTLTSSASMKALKA